MKISALMLGSAAWLLLFVCGASAAEPAPSLVAENLDAFKNPKDGWSLCGDAKLDAANRRKLTPVAGKGVLFSGGGGKDLSTKQSYRDCEVEVEFMVPQGSNSGVKLAGCYEIQLLDSWNKKQLTGSDCGGIYPRGELKPNYHTIDDGVPPATNACREPGQWQTLKIVFRSPRFDADGKKTANAKFERVELNGQAIHENREVAYPTGAAWHNKEHDQGPLLLQGDHGPVAFRNLRIKAL